MEKYRELEKMMADYFLLSYVIEFLEHDMESDMPIGGNEIRAKELGLLEVMKNNIMKNENWKSVFNACIDNKELSEEQRINTKLTHRLWIHDSALPEELLTRLANVKAKTNITWSDAKHGKGGFKENLSNLEEIFEITKEIADIKSKMLKLSPYDALLDSYSPGLSSEKIDIIFNDLKGFLPDFIKQNKKECKQLSNDYSREQKKIYSKKLLELIGFDFNYGRLAEVIHPHMTGPATDVIIAPNFDEDLIKLTGSVIHEGGHGIYQQSLKNYLSPIGSPLGMAIHESQSLFFEKQIGKNKFFLKKVADLLQEVFGDKEELSYNNILKLNREIKPDFIRIESDEATYPLHIIMRYEIEKGILENKIKVKDLPDVWNEKMKEYLGIVPQNDLQGCLQDCHWFFALVGYFPAYTFGALVAAQIMDKMKMEIQNIEQELENGNLSKIREWLYNNIYIHGSSLNFEELVKRATGKELGTDAFKEHLKDRLLDI
ncbi:MAG: carboxypeptidase M32 [Rickettsiales bacterium]|jgi:carboxypeptidase Taq|nr:carboxypeptidase M32 [Rickettsiales bacterium]